jgi:hypothetical protein
MVRVGLDLLPKANNRVVDRTCGDVRVHVSPHLPQQLFPVHDFLAALGEIAEQLELAVCQMDRRLVAAGALRSEVDDELADQQPFERWMRALIRARSSCRSNGLVM